MKLFKLWICLAMLAPVAMAGCTNESNNQDQNIDNNGQNDGNGSQNGGSTDEPKDEYRYETGCNAENCAATCCGDVCRDTTSNADHCGACNHACGENEICQNSECIEVQTGQCGKNEMKCGDSCVTVVKNNEHCGTCDNACTDGTTCVWRTCEIDCGDQIRCDGQCVDALNDRNNCGKCGKTCADDKVCANGSCTDKCPEAGQMVCGGACIDVLADNQNCGECGNVCQLHRTCIDGVCQDVCADPNQVICDSVCSDLMTDNAHCGDCSTPCVDGFYCSNGACIDTCPVEGQKVCNQACTDVASNNDHCGECGIACNDNQRCEAGVCVETCETEDYLVCEHTCMDVTANNAHCGACGNACADNQYCSGSTCIDTCEAEGQKVCGHTCIDVLADNNNCGDCGNICVDGLICKDGACVCPEDNPFCNAVKPTCKANEMLCGTACVDIISSSEHCGNCTTQCSETGMCFEGTCLDCTDKTMCPDGSCRDLQTDAQNCGECGNACPSHVACVGGTCSVCEENYVDVDGDITNGCEKTTAEYECKAGETKSCYFGPAGTQGVGICKAGTMTCTADNHWSECIGQQLPMDAYAQLDCNANRDLDCDGKRDGYEDFDGDGITHCGGDCCDSTNHCTAAGAGKTVDHPEYVRPGFYEDPANGIDDNCNNQTDEKTTCTASYTHGTNLSTAANRDSAGKALAKAMDICDDAKTQGYGLVSATVQSLVSGTPGNSTMGYAINVFPSLKKGGTGSVVISPQAGSSFAGIATGNFYNGNLSDDGGFLYVNGTIPAQYTKVHSTLQTAPGCGTDSEINDTLNLSLRLKAPVNAKGFKFDFRFYSYEYPSYICSQFNDFFLALTDSKATGIPKDGNIAFDKNGNPVSVNNAFFTACAPISCSKDNNCKTAIYTEGCVAGKCSTAYGACPDGTADLYGFYSSGTGGATAWLTTTAPVLPGEEFNLNFYIWDTGDSTLNSAAIIDNFRWITSGGSVSVGTDFSDGRI